MSSSSFFATLLLATILLANTFFSSYAVLYMPLTHSLSKRQFNSTHHLLKATSTHSTNRFHHHIRRSNSSSQVSLPLSPGSDYTITFSIGSQHMSLYMDTGSDLVWFPCSPFECILCEGKELPSNTSTVYNINHSSPSLVSCSSPSCSAVHSAVSSSDLCAMSNCPLESIEMSECSAFSCPKFYYAYADGSLVGKLYRDTLAVPNSSPSLNIKNFTFACAKTTLGEPVGVAGFGGGSLSLPAQLSKLSPQLGSQFSYCLVSHSLDAGRLRQPSPLILGKHELSRRKSMMNVDFNGEFVYTSMLHNPKYPYFYTVGLQGISVGKSFIPTPASMQMVNGKGDGGVVVDSGTTYTMLPSEFYTQVVNEFDHRVRRVNPRAKSVEESTGLGPCYYVEGDADVAGRGKVPVVTLHFAGNFSSVVLPRRNYFYEFLDGSDHGKKARNVGCLMLMNGGDYVGGGPAATFGNYQQQGFEVVYDLENRRVGFARRKCAALWESLNQN